MQNQETNIMETKRLLIWLDKNREVLKGFSSEFEPDINELSEFLGKLFEGGFYDIILVFVLRNQVYAPCLAAIQKWILHLIAQSDNFDGIVKDFIDILGEFTPKKGIRDQNAK